MNKRNTSSSKSVTGSQIESKTSSSSPLMFIKSLKASDFLKCSIKNSRSKRFELKRSDSGLSSDSSDQGLQMQSSSITSSFDERNESQQQAKRKQCVCELNHESFSESKTKSTPIDTTSKTIKPNQDMNDTLPFESSDRTLSSNEELFTMDSSLSSSPKHCHSNDHFPECSLSATPPELYNELGEINYENKSIEEENDELYQYELKVAGLKRQIELISRKLLYMEEHIIDLNTENGNLKKQLNNIEGLYRKKIQIREDEIESLKEIILELEKINSDLRNKEQELFMQKKMHLEDIKLLKQQIISQETEMNIMKNSCEKLSEIEMAYKNTNEQLEALKINNCNAIHELEENYKLKCTEKDFENGLLKAKIEELSHQIIKLENINRQHHQQQQQQQQQDQKINGNKVLDPSQHPTTLTTKSEINNTLPESSTVIDEIKPLESSLSLHLENLVNKKETVMNETKMPNKKRPLKRISSCDIDEDYNESSESNNKIASHLIICDDMKTLDNNNNNNNGSIKFELAIGQNESNRSEVFPSLPDVMLRKLCLLRENTCNIESLSEPEIDAKFHTLLLAFKTDKFTLEQRVQLYRHQRDMAENDAKTELCHLSEYVQELYRLLLGCDSKFFYNSNLIQLKELKDMLDKIDMQVQVIKASVMKISSRSELYGSVKQEERLSTALDVILLHTENLKRSKERDAKELEDMKRLLATSGINKNDPDGMDFDLSHFRRSGRLNSKNKDINSPRINPINLANHLQNIQVSYQQTSRGPSQSYMRTRRLSVPAAEIRNRPKLLQLLSESSKKRLSEELSEKVCPRNEEETSNGEGTITNDNNNLDGPINSKRKLSINIKEQPEEGMDENNNFDGEEEERNDINCPTDKTKANKFYKELIEKLIPLEDKTFKERLNDKLRKLYTTIWLLLLTISENGRYRFNLMAQSINGTEAIRHIISGALIIISIIILIWSVIWPLFS